MSKDDEARSGFQIILAIAVVYTASFASTTAIAGFYGKIMDNTLRIGFFADLLIFVVFLLVYGTISKTLRKYTALFGAAYVFTVTFPAIVIPNGHPILANSNITVSIDTGLIVVVSLLTASLLALRGREHLGKVNSRVFFVIAFISLLLSFVSLEVIQYSGSFYAFESTNYSIFFVYQMFAIVVSEFESLFPAHPKLIRD